MKLSFVIPVFNERETLAGLVEGIDRYAAPHDYQLIVVDDGSTDGSYETLCALREKFDRMFLVRQRGNFGKSAALATGFSLATGDVVITMDSDLQDDPEEIPRFLEKLEEGFDVVCGWKATRRDPWHKTIPSYFYNRFVAWLFALPLHDVNCGFKALRVGVVKRLPMYGELHRLIPVLAHNLNYRVGEIAVRHHPRRYGSSKFGFERFYRGALDVLAVWFLSRYQYSPGHFFGKAGVLLIALGVFSVVASFGLFAGGSGLSMATLVLGIGVLLGVHGLGAIGLGLLAELMLRHFVRMDPRVFAAEVDE